MEIEAARLGGDVSTACASEKEAAEAIFFHTQEVQESTAEWKPVSRLKAKMVYLQEPEGWELVAVEGEGVRRKSRSPPQRRGPVNLVNAEWAPGQMTHLQSSINTAAPGRQGRCYWWPRRPGSTGFLAVRSGPFPAVQQGHCLLDLIGRENREDLQIFMQTGTSLYTSGLNRQVKCSRQTNRQEDTVRPRWDLDHQMQHMWEAGHERRARATAVPIVTRHVKFRAPLV